MEKVDSDGFSKESVAAREARMRELIPGGVTRKMLEKMNKPIWFSR